MSDEKLLDSRHVYRGRVIDLRLDDVRLPNGRTITREIVEHRGAVCILAFDESGRVLLVRQYRAPVRRTLIELPAGTLDRGEDPLACARRELAEETGYWPDEIRPMLGFFSAPGFCTEYLHVFVAGNLRPESHPVDDDEEIELVRATLPEVLELVRTGEIVDAKTIVALLAYAAEHDIGWSKGGRAD